MKKRTLFNPKKLIFLFSILSFLNYQKSLAQCTNPDPSGDTLQEFCKADNPIISDLVASGGLIAWFDAATGGNQLDPNTPLVDGSIYYADDIENDNCSPNRLAVNVEIYGDTPDNVDVFVGKCESENPTIADLSATGTNIEWYDAQTDGNLLNNTDLLVDGQTYWVQQTENGCTSERLPTTVTIIQVPAPEVTNEQTFCESSNPTVADLQPSSGILWYENYGATIPLDPSTPLINGEDYWAVQTSFPCESTTRIQSTVIIEEAPYAGTDGSYTECEIDLATTDLFTLLGDNPDTNGTWTDPNGNSHSGTFTPGVDIEGDYTYTVVSASGTCPDDSSTVSVIINTVPPPTTTNSTQTFCINDYLPNSPTIADLDPSGANVIWYVDETSDTTYNSSDLLEDGQTYWAAQVDSATGCESASRLSVTASIISPELPSTFETTRSFCANLTPTIADLGSTGDGIIWYANETDTVPLEATQTLVEGETYWAAQTDTTTGCESISRLMVTVTFYPEVLAPTVTSPQTFCEADNPTITNLEVTGNSINWYLSETDTTPLNSSDLLEDGQTYWATQTDATTGCESTSRVSVDVTLTDPGTPTITVIGNEFCVIDNPTVADLNSNVTPVSGGTITWYDDYPNGSELSLLEPLTEGATYYAIETNSEDCTSANPLAVTVTLEACDEYDIVIYDGFSPKENGINDTFTIGNLRMLYPDFKVEFYNRWGKLVYTANASKPDWNGRLNGDGVLVPAGVYYFVIYFNKNNRKPLQRSLYLSR